MQDILGFPPSDLGAALCVGVWTGIINDLTSRDENLQARNNVHRAAILLGAAVVGKVGRLGNKLKEHHSKMREEGKPLCLKMFLFPPLQVQDRRHGSRLRDRQQLLTLLLSGLAVEARKQSRRAERGADHNPLKLAFPWQRKRRRGVHNESSLL